MMVAGPTSCGITTWIKSLLENANRMIELLQMLAANVYDFDICLLSNFTTKLKNISILSPKADRTKK